MVPNVDRRKSCLARIVPDTNRAVLARLAAALGTEDHEAGHVLISQGDLGTAFLVVLKGVVTVSRRDSGGSHSLRTLGRGSIVGELSALTRDPRHATVTAATSVQVAFGGKEALELIVQTPEMRESLTSNAAPRFAAVADRVSVTAPDGGQFRLGPLVPADRPQLTAAFARQSHELLQHCFFTPPRPSKQMIDYLVNIDYVDHALGVVQRRGERAAFLAAPAWRATGRT